MIISKVSCFDVKTSWWGCFKDVSSLSDLYLAGNVDDLLYYVTGLVGCCLVPESYESPDDVSKNLSEDDEEDEDDEDDEDKESDKVAI